MAKYPEPNRLKERYSPTKKIPQFKERTEHAGNYEAFAVAPGRSGVLSVTNKDNIDQSITLPRDTASKPHSHKPKPSGFSPIRRSGSPVRRQKINEIEHEAIQNKDKEVLEEINKRAKTVAFTNDTQFNDSSSSLFVRSTSNASSVSDDDRSNRLTEEQFLYVISRINDIQDTQKQILVKLEKLEQKLS